MWLQISKLFSNHQSLVMILWKRILFTPDLDTALLDLRCPAAPYTLVTVTLYLSARCCIEPNVHLYLYWVGALSDFMITVPWFIPSFSEISSKTDSTKELCHWIYDTYISRFLILLSNQVLYLHFQFWLFTNIFRKIQFDEISWKTTYHWKNSVNVFYIRPMTEIYLSSVYHSTRNFKNTFFLLNSCCVTVLHLLSIINVALFVFFKYIIADFFRSSVSGF